MNRTTEIKWLVLCAGVCLALTGARQALAQSQPATYPAPAVASRYVPGDARHFTGREQAILGGVIDGDSQFETTGLYILLEHAARLPAMSDEAANQADQPAIDNLWSQPEAYRGRLIRLRGHYAGLTEERQTASNEWYNKKFYLLHMKVPKARESIVVALTEPPPSFRLAQPVDVTGFMYKTVAWQTREDSGEGGARRLFPVLVARTIAEAEPTDPVKGSLQAMYIVMGATGILILMLAIRLWRLRSVTAPTAFTSRPREVAPAEVQDEVDPELCQIVKEVQSKKEKEE